MNIPDIDARDVLPEIPARYCEAFADGFFECTRWVGIAAILGAASMVIGRNIQVKRKEKTAPGCLWIASIGPGCIGKTTSISPMLKTFQEFDNASKDIAEEMRIECRKKRVKLPPPQQITGCTLCISSLCGIEREIVNNPGGIGYDELELTSLFNKFYRGKKTREKWVPLLLSAQKNGRIAVYGEGSEWLLKERFGLPKETVADELLWRFTYVFSDFRETSGELMFPLSSVPESEREAICDFFKTMAQNYPRMKPGNEKAKLLSFTRGAEKITDDFMEEHDARACDDFLRLSVIEHCLSHPEDVMKHRSINGEDAERAANLAEALIPHREKALQIMGM